jgi:hypothetical protein
MSHQQHLDSNSPLPESIRSPRGFIGASMLGMCYILCMCVCVGASDTTTASDDPWAVFAIFSGFCYF